MAAWKYGQTVNMSGKRTICGFVQMVAGSTNSYSSLSMAVKLPTIVQQRIKISSLSGFTSLPSILSSTQDNVYVWRTHGSSVSYNGNES